MSQTARILSTRKVDLEKEFAASKMSNPAANNKSAQKQVKNFMAIPSNQTISAVIGKPTGARTNGSHVAGALNTEKNTSVGQYKKPGSLAAELSVVNKDKTFTAKKREWITRPHTAREVQGQKGSQSSNFMNRKGQLQSQEMLTNFGATQSKNSYGQVIDDHGFLVNKPKPSLKNKSENIFEMPTQTDEANQTAKGKSRNQDVLELQQNRQNKSYGKRFHSRTSSIQLSHPENSIIGNADSVKTGKKLGTNRRNEGSVGMIVQGGQGSQVLNHYKKDSKNLTTKQASVTFLATRKVWGQKRTTGNENNILGMYMNDGSKEAKDINTLRNEKRSKQLAQKNSSNMGSLISGQLSDRGDDGAVSGRYTRSSYIKQRDSMSGVIQYENGQNVRYHGETDTKNQMNYGQAQKATVQNTQNMGNAKQTKSMMIFQSNVF